MHATVQAGDIFQVIWVSIVAGIVVTVTYSFVVVGTARSAQARRSGRGTNALLYGGLAVVALAAFGATVALGLNIMLSKD